MASYSKFNAFVTDRVELIGGLRYSDDKQYYNRIALPGAPPPPGTDTVGEPAASDEVTGKAGLNFHMSDDLLLYGTVSKGYKAGGVNLTLNTPDFKPETNLVYEAGWKATMLDNQETELKVAQEVPFLTGQYTNSATTTTGNVNPFTTVQRQEVGTILKVTPKINEGSAVVMKIELESSELSGQKGDANSLIGQLGEDSSRQFVAYGSYGRREASFGMTGLTKAWQRVSAACH